jgi:HEAT repeat protein
MGRGAPWRNNVNQEIPLELERALAAFESGDLDQIIREGRREHFEVLRQLASAESGVKKEYRQKAIYALGRWGDTSAVPDILKVLPKLDGSERITAIDALGRLGTNQARQAVASFAGDPSPQVRKFVVQALGRMGGPEAATHLRDIAGRDREVWIRQLAAKQIGEDQP